MKPFSHEFDGMKQVIDFFSFLIYENEIPGK